MDRRRFSLLAATLLLVAAVVFFVLPAALDYDAFIPVMAGIACLLGAFFYLFAGFSAE